MSSEISAQPVLGKLSELYASCNKKNHFRLGVEFLAPYLATGQTVLDIGCGTGDLCGHVGEHVGSGGVVIGVDPDLDRIRLAKEKFGHLSNVTFLACKGSEIPISGLESKCDLMFSTAVFHWMDNEEKRLSLQKVYTLLKPGGVFLVQYINLIPPRMEELAAFIGDEELEKLQNLFKFISKENMIKLCQDAGLSLSSVDSWAYSTTFYSLSDLCELCTSALQGAVDFRQAITKMDKEGNTAHSLEWARGNEIYHTGQNDRLVLRKPS